MRKLGALFALALLAGLAHSQDNANLRLAAECSNRLAIDLYKHFSAGEGNLFFSPYSVSCLLALGYAGARGQTAEQIASVLRFSSEGEKLHAAYAELQAALDAIQQKGTIQLVTANALWPQRKYPLRPEFLGIAEKSYRAEVIPVDYAKQPALARELINAWVEAKTQKRIVDILPGTPDKGTRLFAANAVYFKGSWASRFEKSATKNATFYLKANKTREAAMMQQTSDLKYGEVDELQLVEMPYDGKELSMLIALPREIEGLGDAESALSADKLKDWNAGMFARRVELYLPKFQMSFEAELGPALKALGVQDAFKQHKADFSGIDGRKHWLYIGLIRHKAFIDVNEEGTEAAAATAGGGCFAAGTVVLTASGPCAIEQVEQGRGVVSFDLQTGEWRPARVRTRLSRSYEGDMVRVRAGQVEIQATGSQPIYVLRGEALDGRPAPRDVAVAEQQTAQPGRWVQARALRVGDLLLCRGGKSLGVTGLESRQEKTTVYNLDVEGFRNYAVTAKGILAHNKGGMESPPVLFRADHPFLFLIRENLGGSILFMGRVREPE
jgi:serpin B